MTDRLSQLWASWLDAGLPFGVLVGLLALAALVWLTSTILSARTAARHDRSPFGWAFLVAMLPVLGMALALLWPVTLPWFAAGAAAVAALLALLSRWLIGRAEAR